MTKKKEIFKPSETQFDTADVFVPDDECRKELGIAPMTMHRWDNSKKMAQLGWPPKIKHDASQQARGYRSRRLLEIFKKNVIRLAIEQRNKLLLDEEAA